MVNIHMSEVFIFAITALESEIAQSNGDPALFEREQPLRELMNAGLSPTNAEKALEEAEEYLRLWEEKAQAWRCLQRQQHGNSNS
jgi:hypothetical protein